MPLVVLIALVAGALFAVAGVLQQRANVQVSTVPDAPSLPVTGSPRRAGSLVPVAADLRELAQHRLFLVGWAVNVCGFFAQAAALHLGSVAVVQPLLVTQLLFTMVLTAWWRRTWPPRRDLPAALAICLGLGLFMAVRGDELSPSAGHRAVIRAVIAASLVVVLLVVLAGSQRTLRHTVLVAAAAGVCFALSAVFIKLTATALFHQGVLATATTWPGYALAASTTAGLILEQEAFASGSLPTAVAAMTITNPVISYLLGILGFGVGLPDEPWQLALFGFSALLVTIGVVILAHSPTTRSEPLKSLGTYDEMTHDGQTHRSP